LSVIAITGGGSAGHIMPALALVPKLKPYFDNIIYIGNTSPENKLVPPSGIPFYSVSSVKLNRNKFFSNLKIPKILLRGIAESKDILKSECVTIVFSKGGYVSLPVCIASILLKIPLIVHESDYSLGLANRLTAPFAKLVLTSFAETRGGIYLGNPVRDEILTANPLNIRNMYSLDNKPIVLIIGGSSGSTAINNAVYPILKQLTSKFNVFHITGKTSHLIEMRGYFKFEYVNNICDLYAASDIVITRGGANALSECAALGKKTLCIPLPAGPSRGDQLENARCYQKLGIIRILEQKDLTPYRLLKEIELTNSLSPPKAIVSNAASNIVKEILSII
jgi:UDP-N-acetylglucosamine--N-acetylmuramyl-(pentapeptide) pyrophosphoryl-undecaprenol N-acetylglucosamine transferase